MHADLDQAKHIRPNQPIQNKILNIDYNIIDIEFEKRRVELCRFDMTAPGQTPSRGSNTLLLFGGLILSQDASMLKQMRETVIAHGEHSWLMASIRALPKDYETALSHLPFFDQATTTTINQALSDIVSSFLTASFENITLPLPNAVLIPLAVITQLAHYADFTRQSSTGLPVAKEALGFCTGLLSAFAVASAHDTVDLQKYGAAAMRLGMLVGLVVDSEDAASKKGRYRSVSASWDSEDKHSAMVNLIKNFDEVSLIQTIPPL